MLGFIKKIDLRSDEAEMIGYDWRRRESITKGWEGSNRTNKIKVKGMMTTIVVIAY